MTHSKRVPQWVRVRIRLVGSAVVVGWLLAAAAMVVLTFQYDPQFVSTQLFLVWALCFGFGLLGWSGSVLAGRSVENAQQYLDTGMNWSESDSRRAMARIGGFGFGGMIGVICVATVLGV